MHIHEFQELMDRTYGDRDRARGATGCALWLSEELGETMKALRVGDRDALAMEMADVFAWLASLANVCGLNLETAVNEKYGSGCPRCGFVPCRCEMEGNPLT